MKIHAFIAVLALLLFGMGCEKEQAKVESLRLDHDFTFQTNPFDHRSAFDVRPSYHLGMSRDELRRILGTNQLVSSTMRPLGGWRSMKGDDYTLGVVANQIESSYPTPRVIVCDLYKADGDWHLLFFDTAGSLVGFQRSPSMVYYCDGLTSK
jgi:hypothetical protein